MNLHSLTLEGFMSYRQEQHVNFTPGVTYILGENQDNPGKADSNGVGKSALEYAICWALYGTIPPGCNKNDLLHWEGDRAKVDLELMGEGGHLRIIRTKLRTKPESLTWILNGFTVEMDLVPSQARLDATLGISWQVFLNALYLGASSKGVQFVTARPAERALILGELVNDLPFRKAADLVSRDVGEKQRKVERNLETIRHLEQEDLRLQQALTRLDAQVLQEQQRVRVAGEHRDKEVYRLMEAQAKLKQESAEPITVDTTALTVEIGRLREQASTIREGMGRARAEIAANDLGDLSEGDRCPKCKQTISRVHAMEIDRQKQEAEVALHSLEGSLAGVDSTIGEKEVAYRRALEALQERQGRQRRIDSLQEQIVLLRSRGDEQGAAGALLQEKQATLARVQELRAEMQEAKAAILTLRGEIPVLEDVLKGFRTEIRNMQLDEVRQILGYYTEKYRWLLAGSEFSIAFPPTTATGQEKFEIVVSSGGVVNPLTSAGESWRATFAIWLALRRVLTHGNLTPLDFLLIDDPYHGGLDDTGIREFSNLLSSLTGEIPTVLVAVPRVVPGMAEGNTLLVTRRNRKSTIRRVA